MLRLRRSRLGTISVDSRRGRVFIKGCSRTSGTTVGELSGVDDRTAPGLAGLGWASRLVMVRCTSAGPCMVLWLSAGLTGGTAVWPCSPPRTGAVGSIGKVWACTAPAHNKLTVKKICFTVELEKSSGKQNGGCLHVKQPPSRFIQLCSPNQV